MLVMSFMNYSDNKIYDFNLIIFGEKSPKNHSFQRASLADTA